MTATLEEKRGYQRGYNAGLKRAWGSHLPPLPPQSEFRKLLDAATSLRNCVDSYLACIDPDDDLQETLGKGIDSLDGAMADFKEWAMNFGEQPKGK